VRSERTCVLIISSLLFGLPACGNLITNGSFEEGTYSPTQWGWQTLVAGNNSITGWVVGNGSVDYVGAYWQPAHGSRSLDLNGDGSQGTIWQVFSSTPGRLYRVTFALAGNPDAQPRTTTLRVWADDPSATFADFSFTVNGQTYSEMGWTYHSWIFSATSGQTRLGFTSLDAYSGPVWGQNWGTSFGPALDNVTVEALGGEHLPEPGTLMLVGLGLAGSAWLRRRFKPGL